MKSIYYVKCIECSTKQRTDSRRHIQTMTRISPLSFIFSSCLFSCNVAHEFLMLPQHVDEYHTVLSLPLLRCSVFF